MDRGRPEKLTDELKREITRNKKAHSKKTAVEIHDDLRGYLIDVIKKEIPNLTKDQFQAELEDRMPGLDTIRKYLTTIAPPIKKTDNPLDIPWNLGLTSKAEYSMSPEAIKHILRVQKLILDKKWRMPITFRLARWIAKFYSAIKDTQDLYSAAYIYSAHEIICEISNTPFNTTELDKALSKSVNRLRKVSLELQKNNMDASYEAFVRIEGLNFEDGEANG